MSRTGNPRLTPPNLCYNIRTTRVRYDAVLPFSMIYRLPPPLRVLRILSTFTQTLVRLRCPGHAPLTFAALADDSEELTSKIWRGVLVREISRLRRERVAPQTTFGTSSWRFWNPLGVSISGSGNRSLWMLHSRGSNAQVSVGRGRRGWGWNWLLCWLVRV